MRADLRAPPSSLCLEIDDSSGHRRQALSVELQREPEMIGELMATRRSRLRDRESYDLVHGVARVAHHHAPGTG